MMISTFSFTELSFLCISALSLAQTGVSEPDDTASTNTTLELVQLLFRHGDRSPIATYPNDKYQENSWKYGFGSLTDIGAQQAFDLGRYLRVHYLSLSLANISDHQVFVRSTAITRAVMTAHCVMAGIIKPDSVTTFNPRKDYQPITVHQPPSEEDQLLAMAPCPLYSRLHDTWLKTSSLWANHSKKYQELYRYLSKYTGWKVNDSNIGRISDAVYCERKHKLQLASWLNDTIVSQILQVFNDTTQYAFPTQEMQNLTGGPLLEKMLQSIHEKIFSKQNKMKLYVYSAHDTNVIAFLSSLGVFNNLQPPYVACVMVELHRIEKVYYVKVFYKNHTGDPHLLKIPGCEELCHLAQLHRLVKNVTLKAENRAEVCGPVWGSTKMKENIVPLVIGGLLLLAAAVAIAAVLFLRRRKKSTKAINYRQLLQDSEATLLDSDDDELL